MDEDILIGILNRIEEINDFITLKEQFGYDIDNCDDCYLIEEKLSKLKNRIYDL